MKDHEQPPHEVLVLRKSAIVVVAFWQAIALDGRERVRICC